MVSHQMAISAFEIQPLKTKLSGDDYCRCWEPLTYFGAHLALTTAALLLAEQDCVARPNQGPVEARYLSTIANGGGIVAEIPLSWFHLLESAIEK